MSDGAMRTAEVAEVLDLSESTVIRYAREGLLVATRTVGNHRRYTRDSVTALGAVLAIRDEQRQRDELDALRQHNQASDTT